MMPRDAATLIILRNQREVLLGRRSRAHVFMPQKFVFPGGRVDAGDGRVRSANELPASVTEKLTRGCSKARARALAMAAVRETWEETGLLLGTASDTRRATRSPAWQGFFAEGLAPVLAPLDYIARAITPPGRSRRFDARFFLVDAKHLQGEIRGNGELEELQWVALEDTEQLPLSPITQLVLQLLQQRLQGDSSTTAVPMYRELYGKELIEHH